MTHRPSLTECKNRFWDRGEFCRARLLQRFDDAGAMYAAGTPSLQVMSSPAMFSGPDGCPTGLSSPGHNFASLAGGDIAALQQLGLRHQQQFYPPIGMIHPVTCGDTTTDSGSLYTTPPALCPILAGTIPRNNRHNESRSGFSVASSEEEDNGGEVSTNEAEDEGERDDEDGENMRRRPPVARAERSSVTASSASEGAQRNSTSTANEGVVGGEESISIETNENLALLRPSVTSNGTNGRRKRPTKHRRQRNQNGGSSRTATEGLQTSSTTAPFPRTMLHPSQAFVAQPFSSADMLGTEYASTSLFGSSTASNHGGLSGTMKKGSSSLLDPSGGQYPSPYLQNCGQNSSATVGVNGNTSYHLYQPILVPHQQAHLFQNAVAAAGGFMDTHQLGGLVQTSPFLSQGVLHSTVPHTAAYNPEASIAVTTTTANGVGGGWPVQQDPGALTSSSGTPLPPVPSLPLPPNPHLTNHHGLHYSSTNDGTSSGRLSIYSVCMSIEEGEQSAEGLYTNLIWDSPYFRSFTFIHPLSLGRVANMRPRIENNRALLLLSWSEEIYSDDLVLTPQSNYDPPPVGALEFRTQKIPRYQPISGQQVIRAVAPAVANLVISF
ncbi:unnamed protein product [Rodentolepis nana]|uniref:Homeobox domain-containing protein n=1 Tax=Rodentolepis nana TaxID=102285 RepID=A0A0R3TYE7_RODNA|nr:unnamed protein product [Rodentolepis nana]